MPQTLWAEKTFICASAHYEPGRYLAFLESVGPNEWITLNHQQGALRIDPGGQVKGFGFYGRSREWGAGKALEAATEAIPA